MGFNSGFKVLKNTVTLAISRFVPGN